MVLPMLSRQNLYDLCLMTLTYFFYFESLKIYTPCPTHNRGIR
jgi:hypothetical protein